MNFHRNHLFNFSCFIISILMAMDKKRKSIWKYFWKQFHMKIGKNPQNLIKFWPKTVLFRKKSMDFQFRKTMLFRKPLLENRVSGGLPVIYFCFFWLTHLSETSYNFSLKWQHFTFWMGVERKILSFWGKKSFLQFCKKLSFGKLLYFEVMHKICWKHLFFIDI